MQPAIPHISRKSTMDRLQAANVGFDQRYPGSRSLAFLDRTTISAFWEFPLDVTRLSAFVFAAVESIEASDRYLLLPRKGVWGGRTHDGADNDINGLFLQKLGVQLEWDGAIEIADKTLLCSVIVLNILFCTDMDDNLYVFPSRSSMYLQTDHHGVLCVYADEPKKLANCALTMKRFGFDLPEEVPDETFRRPSWMSE